MIFDPLLLERAVQYAVNRFTGARITKILLLGVKGVPLGVILAHGLGVKLVIAKNTREARVSAFFEEVYVPGRVRWFSASTFPVTLSGAIAS